MNWATFAIGMSTMIPYFVQMAESLINAPKSGPTKLQWVLGAVQGAAQVAGIADPTEQGIISAIVTTGVNATVAINNSLATKAAAAAPPAPAAPSA